MIKSQVYYRVFIRVQQSVFERLVVASAPEVLDGLVESQVVSINPIYGMMWSDHES